MIHPQEALLQEARAFQQSEAFAPYRKLRQVAEHRLARLMQLGVHQARYIGRTKTLFQLLLAATVANLTLVASRVGLMRDRNHIRAHSSNQVGDLLTTILRAICRPFVVGVLPWTTAEGQVFGHTSRQESTSVAGSGYGYRYRVAGNDSLDERSTHLGVGQAGRL